MDRALEWKKFNFVNSFSSRWITWFKIQVKQTRPNVDHLSAWWWGGWIFIHFLGFQTLIIILKLYRVCNLLQFSPSSNWLVFLWHSYGCCKCQCVCESFGHLCDTEPLWQEITKFCPKIHLKSGTLHNLLVLKVFTFLTILTKCKNVSSICFFYKFR